MTIKRFYNLSLENEGLEIDKILVAQQNVDESSGADQLLNKIDLDEQTTRLDDASTDQSNTDGGLNENTDVPEGQASMDQAPLSDVTDVSSPESSIDQVVDSAAVETPLETEATSEVDSAPQSDVVVDTDVQSVEDPVAAVTSTDTPVDTAADTSVTDAVDTPAVDTPVVDEVTTPVVPATDETVSDTPTDAVVEDPDAVTPVIDATTTTDEVATTSDASIDENGETDERVDDTRDEEVEYDEHGIPIVREDDVERIARECQCNMESETAAGVVTPETFADISLASDNAEDVNDQVVEALENYINVKEIKTALESAMVYGGVDSIGAQVAFKRFKQVSEYHGLKAKWPALENFNSPSMKSRTNKLAIEAMSEFLGKLIQGVIDGILAFIKAVADYVKKQFNAFVGFKQNIEKLKQAASKITKTNTAEKFKDVNAIKKIVCESDTDVVMNAEILKTYLTNVREPIETVHRASYDDLKQVIADILDGTTMPPKNHAYIVQIRDFEDVIGRPVPGYDFGEDVTVKVYNQTLPGNYEAIYGLPKDDQSVLDDEKRHNAALKACRFTFITKTGQKEFKELPLLSPDQISNTLDSLKALIDTAEPFQTFFDSFVNEKNKIVRDLKAMATSVNKTKTPNETDEQKTHREGTTMFVESISARTAFTEKVYFNAMSSSLQLTSGYIANVLTYVTESISAHI